MKRNLGIGVLIICFGTSSIHPVFADAPVVNVSPIMVDPGEVQDLNQQMLDRDRKNRDEEIAIRQLVEQNDKLTQSTLARQEDEGLAKIDQTMLSYRDALLARDRARIDANSQRPWIGSRYGDLIKLTEDADDITVHQDLVNKDMMLAQKYQMLSQLKDEMTALNDKLSTQDHDKSDQKDQIIEGYKKIAQQQQDKIQMLVSRLDGMDRRIAHYDAIIAAKDQEIAHLQQNLEMTRNESKDKDDTIKQQESQITILQQQAQMPRPVEYRTQRVVTPAPDNQEQLDLLKSELENKITEEQQTAKELLSQNKIIKNQQNQIADLENNINGQHPNSTNPANPVTSVNPAQATQIIHLKDQIQQQVDDLMAKDKVIKDQSQQMRQLSQQTDRIEPSGNDQVAQIINLKDQIQRRTEELADRDKLIQTQAAQLASLNEQLKNQSQMFGVIQSKVANLKTQVKDRLQHQGQGMKDKDVKINWLNQVLAAEKNKEQYFKLTAQEQHLSLRQAQDQLQQIKDDLAKHAQNTDQLTSQLFEKQNQVDALKSQLQDKSAQVDAFNQQQAQLEQDLKGQVQSQAELIAKMNGASSENLQLAQELINLEQQETALLEEKSRLTMQQYDIFERHYGDFENKMNALISARRWQEMDARDQMGALKEQLAQEENEVGRLKQQLVERITLSQNQGQLQMQMEDLKAQLQDKENQISNMQSMINAGQISQVQQGALTKQLTDERHKVDLLKQELENKITQAKQMTLIINDYQQKLESRNTSYNQQLSDALSSKDQQVQSEKDQIHYLNTQLRQKQAAIVKIKDEMDQLQELMNAKFTDVQARDLSLSMAQQKMMDAKIMEYQQKIKLMLATRGNESQEIKDLRTELALARQSLVGMPSSDELNFLRAGLKKASTELLQKEALLAQVKANAEVDAEQLKKQSAESQNLKDQLQDAYDQLSRRNEDLKYKNLEVVRLKEQRAAMGGAPVVAGPQSDLQKQIQVLTEKLAMAEKRLHRKMQATKAGELELQLDRANDEIKQLRQELDEYIVPSKKDALRQKLQQALDKINEQGRMIDILAQKLQESGKSVDLSQLK